MFYTNLTDHYSFVKTFVKVIKIILTSSILATIVRIPRHKIQLIVHNTWPEIPSGLVVLSNILGRDLDHIDFPYTSNLLNLKMYVLHLMTIHILFPRYGVRLNLSFMMLTHMCSLLSHNAKTILSYGMYLTKVFHFFYVGLFVKSYLKHHHTHCYKHSSCLCMSYSFHDTRKAYHCVEASIARITRPKEKKILKE